MPLTVERRPKAVRGGCGFGADTFMKSQEDQSQPYLFKLRLSKNGKRNIEPLFWDAGWTDAGQGGEGRDGTLRLSRWEAHRHVIVLHRTIKNEMLIAQGEDGQGLLRFVEADRKVGKRTTDYEYAVLATNLDNEVLSLGQLYRDRADAENAFDELKNQWGWGSFTTPDLYRCKLSARAIDLIYNWWRLCHPTGQSRGASRGHYQRTVVDVLGRLQDGTHWPVIDHCHRIACAFPQGVRCPDAHLRLVQGSGRLRCEQLGSTTVWRLVCDHLKHVLASIGPPKIFRTLADQANGIG